MPANSTSSVSVVSIGAKKCKPFLLEVMVFSPESGYKFEVLVEKGCTMENDPIWKVVFDLYKKEEGEEEFVQIVHVSFRAGSAEEQRGVKKMAFDGVSQGQADAMVEDVFPATKAIEGDPTPSPEKKKAIREAMHKAVTSVEV